MSSAGVGEWRLRKAVSRLLRKSLNADFVRIFPGI